MVTFNVLLYSAPTYSATTDITSDVLSIPIFTDTGDGEINTCIIRLSGKGDQYYGTINDHDRIKLTVTDDGNQTYIRSFEIMSKITIKNKVEPPTLQLELVGIEVALQRVRIAVNTFSLTTRELYDLLIDCYNDNKTDEMPVITYDSTDIPDIMPNLDWSTEDTILNRLEELSDVFGASGENNGVLDFYDVRFTTNYIDSIGINFFSSGSESVGNLETISNPISLEGKVEPEKISQVASWGDNVSGSLPYAWSKFIGRQLIMPTNKGSESNFPPWTSSQKYPINSKVKYITSSIDKVFKKVTTNITTSLTTNPNSNTTDWDEFTTSDYYGTDFSYSPWTANKLAVWKNNGAGFTSSPFSGITNNSAGTCFFDGNLIINDSSSESPSFRTWVDTIALSPAYINIFLLYDNSLTGVYDGFRVLVKGTGSSDFSGHNNEIMEYNGTSWIKKYSPKTDMVVVILDTALPYKYSGSSWVDYSGTANSLDCLHPYSNIYRDTSAILNPDDTSTLPADRQYPEISVSNTKNNKSAITVEYTWNAADSWVTSLIDSISGVLETKRNFYASGAWLSFRFPFPANTYNSISEEVGELYGGTNTGNKIPYLDLENSTYTHTGKIGFNQDDSEDLGQISSVDFFMKIDFASSASTNSKYAKQAAPFLDGNFPMKMFLIDKNDHVVVQDFTLNFNKTWQDVSLPISGFSQYRGRRPKAISALANVIPPKDLEYNAIFETRHLKMMCICTIDSYDDYGRFAPSTNMFGGGLHVALTKTLKLSIDALRFTKPLLAITNVIPSNSTTPLKQTNFIQRPNIFVYDQLKNDADVELQKMSFPYEEYNITTQTNFLINFGKYFYLTDGSINHDDNGENTVKLVAKHIEYSITKPVNNIGGLVRKIRGIRRYVA